MAVQPSKESVSLDEVIHSDRGEELINQMKDIQAETRKDMSDIQQRMTRIAVTLTTTQAQQQDLDGDIDRLLSKVNNTKFSTNDSPYWSEEKKEELELLKQSGKETRRRILNLHQELVEDRQNMAKIRKSIPRANAASRFLQPPFSGFIRQIGKR